MKFDYGKDGIEINLDRYWNVTTLHPDYQKVIENPVKAIRKAIWQSVKWELKIYNKILSREIVVVDQWQIQVLTRILMKADVFLVSSLDEKNVGNIGLKSAETVEDAINEALKKHGKKAKILFLPNGPQVLPMLKNLP